MAVLSRTLLKDFNPILMREELITLAVSLGVTLRIRFMGFDKVSDRLVSPSASRRKIGSRRSGGVLTEFFADPGEFEITSSVVLNASQESQLDTALNGHNATQRSGGQQRDDRDNLVDQPRLIVLLQKGVGTFTSAERIEYLTLLGRLFLRLRDTNEPI